MSFWKQFGMRSCFSVPAKIRAGAEKARIRPVRKLHIRPRGIRIATAMMMTMIPIRPVLPVQAPIRPGQARPARTRPVPAPTGRAEADARPAAVHPASGSGGAAGAFLLY